MSFSSKVAPIAEFAIPPFVITPKRSQFIDDTSQLHRMWTSKLHSPAITAYADARFKYFPHTARVRPRKLLAQPNNNLITAITNNHDSIADSQTRRCHHFANFIFTSKHMFSRAFRADTPFIDTCAFLTKLWATISVIKLYLDQIKNNVLQIHTREVSGNRDQGGRRQKIDFLLF